MKVAQRMLYLHASGFLEGGLEGSSGAEPASVVGCPEGKIVTSFAQQLYYGYSSYYLSREPSTADRSLFPFFHLSPFPSSLL